MFLSQSVLFWHDAIGLCEGFRPPHSGVGGKCGFAVEETRGNVLHFLGRSCIVYDDICAVSNGEVGRYGSGEVLCAIAAPQAAFHGGSVGCLQGLASLVGRRGTRLDGCREISDGP